MQGVSKVVDEFIFLTIKQCVRKGAVNCYSLPVVLNYDFCL